MAKEAKPWERQEGETPKQFEAFVIYRNMGDERSLSSVAQQLNKSKQLLGRWSAANNWVERCTAWDNEQDRILRQEQIKDIKRMRQRHASIAADMLEAATKGLKHIKEHPEEMTSNDVSRLVDVASKLERLSRGDTSEVIEERQGEAISAVQIYLPDNKRGRGNDDFSDLDVE